MGTAVKFFDGLENLKVAVWCCKLLILPEYVQLQHKVHKLLRC